MGGNAGGLHSFELAILMLLVEAGEPAHAYAIVSDLETRQPGQRIYPANLYRRLGEMVDVGWLEEAPVPADADPRRRRYYGITAEGRRVAKAEAERLARLVDGARRIGLLGSA